MTHGLPVVAYAAGAVPRWSEPPACCSTPRAPVGWPRRCRGSWPIPNGAGALVAAGRAGVRPPSGSTGPASDLVAALRRVAEGGPRGRGGGPGGAVDDGPLRPPDTPDQLGSCAHGIPLHTPASLVTAGSAGTPEMKSGTDVGPGSDIFQRLLKERIVFIGSAIDQNTANLVCSQLILLEAENQERDISVYINSPGGSVTDGLAIYDTMQYVRCDVRTICVGLAASMGQFLLCAGTPGKRFALPHSRILMHQPSGGMQGQASDIAIQAEQIIYMKRMLAERIAFHTGQPVERIEADSDRDRWFTAEEAREYGFIDEVIQKDAMQVPTAGTESAT